jgi:hypothetical protein
MRDSFAEGINVADDVVAWGEREWRSFGIEAVPHEDVGVGDTDGEVFYANLAGARCREVSFDQLENFGTTLSGDDDSEIFLYRHVLLSF